MRIRTRLFLLMLLSAAAVLVNILALVYLARSIASSLATIENARARQQLVTEMHQELSNAEADLYRYQLEGATGFAAQFDFESAAFARNVQAYQSLATSTNERSWGNELTQIQEDVSALGKEVIRLHDEQTTNLQTLLRAKDQLAALLDPLQGQRTSSIDDQIALEGMRVHAQALALAVSAYLVAPNATTRDQFTQATQQFQQNAGAFRRLATTASEASSAPQIDATFQQMQTLGAQLLSDRDQQQLAFTRFSAEIFEAEQLVIVEQIQPLEEQRLNEAQQNLQTAVFSAIAVSLAVPIALTIIAALLALRLARTMDRNILTLLRGADRIAAGQLDQPVQVHTADELQRLANAFNRMMTDLAAREQHLRARLAELETLRQVSLQITSTLDLDQVLTSIVSSALTLVNASSVHILTRDETSGALQLVARAGAEPPELPNIDRLIEVAASSAQPHVVNESPAMAVFPLRLGAQGLGVLSIASAKQSAFTDEDIRILNLLADQAAVALGNARLYKNLAAREEHVRTLMAKMEQIQDEERRLIGLDLHDGLTQLVISAKMHLNALNSLLGAALDARARQELEASRALVQNAIDEARRVIAELRPTVVEDFGLAEGLRRYVMEVGEANNWQTEIQIQLDDAKISPPAQAAIFRIAQEALTNAHKHSDTRAIRVVLQCEDSDLLLRVQDWGRGFDPAALPDEMDRLGLISMHERAHMLGGSFKISSQPGQGTTVSVRVPLSTLLRKPGYA